MQTWVHLTFLATLEEVQRRLDAEPTGLVRPSLRSRESAWGSTVTAVMQVRDEATCESIFSWGQTIVAGRTLVKHGNIVREFERSDLDGLEYVELRLNEGGVESFKVVNHSTAYEGEYDCDRCARFTYRQTCDFVLDPTSDFFLDPDEERDGEDWPRVAKSSTGEMLLSAPLISILTKYGVATRQTSLVQSASDTGMPPYFQVVPDQQCNFISPKVESELCPVCERPQWVGRGVPDRLYGHPDGPHFPVSVANQATIRLPDGIRDFVLARTREQFGAFEPPAIVAMGPRGARVPPRDMIFPNSTSYLFARARMVADLVDAGATEFTYRPVVVERL